MRFVRHSMRLELVLTLVALAVLLNAAFDTMRLAAEHAGLYAIHVAQEPPIQEIVRLRGQVETLAGETALLADSGNANARAVVEEMQRQGVTLHPPSGGK